jgi:glycine/D-amino acid oxidase-like deaminating enzyme
MKIAVIGGGIQGCLAAIELELRGHQIVLFERDQALMMGASRWNEGKIHLGYLFAKDPSLRTTQTLIDGATRFAPLMRRYLERDMDFIPRSNGFVYAVHRASMVSAETVGGHLARAHTLVDEALSCAGRDYLGERMLSAPRPSAPGKSGLEQTLVAGAYLTQEVSIDSAALAGAITERVLASPSIRSLMARTIASISRDDDGRFTLAEVSGARHGPFDHVVNAAWDGRLALDESLGYAQTHPWLHRLKVALHGEGLPRVDGLPTVTFVLGPFGDVVHLGNGKLYLSWYPVSRIASYGSVAPPRHDQEIEAARRSGVAGKVFERLSELVPALATVDHGGADFVLNGGYIFAWGRTDIDDAASELHLRYDIGVHSDRGYHSIDTGKLTMAPLFAQTVGERIGPLGHRR